MTPVSSSTVTPQVVPRHNWSGRTIHSRFGCHRWSGRTIYGCHGWSALPQVVPQFILLQMPNTGSLATYSLPYIIYMVKYKAAERGVATEAFCPGPHAAYGPQRSIYSNRTVKHSIKAVTTYIFPGPLKLFWRPWLNGCYMVSLSA